MGNSFEKTGYDNFVVDEFNINVAYLRLIYEQMVVYINVSYDSPTLNPQKFENMYRALKTIENLASPKVDRDDVEKDLAWLEKNRGAWATFSSTGGVSRINYRNIMILQDRFDDCFRKILLKLEKQGMLTKKNSDPRKSMGRFGGS